MDILDQKQVDKTCSICLSFLTNPQICNKCHNKFCYKCIQNIKICPLCRTNPFTYSKYIEVKTKNDSLNLRFNSIRNEIIIKGNENLVNMLEERKFVVDKIPKWKDVILLNMKNFLNIYDSKFKFFLYCVIFKKPNVQYFMKYKYIGLETDGQLKCFFENEFFISFLLIFGAINLSINQYFKSEKDHIKNICQKSCEKFLTGKTFINNEIKKLNESILNDISNELGNFVDYRFFINVIIVKKSTAQYFWGMRLASCNEGDDSLHYLFENNSLYCNIFVFGCS